MARKVNPVCSVSGCTGVHYGRGYCTPHYRRWKRYGDPLGVPVRPSVETRFWAKVNIPDLVIISDDDCWLWTGSRVKGYGTFNADGHAHGRGRTPVYAHRFSYQLLVGPIPEGLGLDHRPTCPKRCVNPAHLRPATQKQNNENRSGAQRNSKTGVRGVCLHTCGRYVAQVKHNGKQNYLGLFDTIAEADAVCRAKRLELFTHNDMDRAS